MKRWLLVLALLVPLAALADKAKKKPAGNGVEIWPPPAPGTDQAGEKKPKPKPEPKPPEEPDGGVGELDPALATPTAPPKPQAEPDDDDAACDDAYADCKDDCAITHAPDDTLPVQKAKKAPGAKCPAR